MFEKLTIIAPGLLGASLAMAVRERGLARSIAIYARRPDAVEQLKSKNWCDLATSDFVQACRGSDFIVLCAPVERIIEIAETILPALDSNPIVTDVGSAKEKICDRCERILQGKARFIGSHPMAGSEKTGMENAESDLFANRSCFVTPTEATTDSDRDQVIAFWKALDSIVLTASPSEHDAIVAKVSHLPHVLASSLASYLSLTCPDSKDSCGNGLKDTTRVASGDPQLWLEILSQNRPHVLQAIDEFTRHLQSVKAAIETQNDSKLIEILAAGKAFRDRL